MVKVHLNLSEQRILVLISSSASTYPIDYIHVKKNESCTEDTIVVRSSVVRGNCVCPVLVFFMQLHDMSSQECGDRRTDNTEKLQPTS